MISSGFLVTIGIFIAYYFIVLFSERRLIREPREIIAKFLSVILLYGGVSIIYFSFTGKPLWDDSMDTYSIFIFMMGFIAVLWAIPTLLKEFAFFRNFMNARAKKKTLAPQLNKSVRKKLDI